MEEISWERRWKPLPIEAKWVSATVKACIIAVEEDDNLRPTRPLCLTFSAAGAVGYFESSQRGKGRHMAGVGRRC